MFKLLGSRFIEYAIVYINIYKVYLTAFKYSKIL